MIPLYSAAAAHEGMALDATLQRVLQRQWFVLGEEVRAFEREFAQWCGVAHCVITKFATPLKPASVQSTALPSASQHVVPRVVSSHGAAGSHASGVPPGSSPSPPQT